MKKQNREAFKKSYVLYIIDNLINLLRLLKKQVNDNQIVVKTLDDLIIEYSNLLEVIENIQEQLEGM